MWAPRTAGSPWKCLTGEGTSSLAPRPLAHLRALCLTAITRWPDRYQSLWDFTLELRPVRN
eukprot:scaffold3540_cov379-Prasinococcus_capsulatus_cf.AAC.10